MTSNKHTSLNNVGKNMEPIDINNKDQNSDERRKSSTGSALFNSYFTLDRHALSDLISTKLHSDDFIATRTSYITIRLWFMCMFFAFSGNLDSSSFLLVKYSSSI